MTYVLDASVAVAALRPTESGHLDALRRCLPLFAGKEDVIVPSIFDLEVFAALRRRGVELATLDTLFAKHFTRRKLVTIGPRATRAACVIAYGTRLRAADALYVWLAARERLPLVTADTEILQRAALAGVQAVPP